MSDASVPYRHEYQPIPVISLMGYLGTGKTSCLNHILAYPSMAARKIALVINEFGSLGVDGRLVQSAQHPTYEINKGSVFCTCTRTEFMKTFTTIAEEIRPDLVLLETTGIADPCDLGDSLDTPHLKHRFTTQGVVCLVDALNFFKVAPFAKAAQNQVLWADGLILNKTDLVSEPDVEQVAQAVRRLNPRAPLAKAEHGAVSEAFLAGLEHASRSAAPATTPPERVLAVTVKAHECSNRANLLASLKGLGRHLLRVKGIVDWGAGPELLQGVFQRITVEPAPAGAARNHGLTVIVQGLESDMVRTQLLQAPSDRHGSTSLGHPM